MGLARALRRLSGALESGDDRAGDEEEAGPGRSSDDIKTCVNTLSFTDFGREREWERKMFSSPLNPGVPDPRENVENLIFFFPKLDLC